MEEARAQQLLEVADDPDVDQGAHVPRLALAKLLAIQPLGREDTAGGQLVVRAWDNNLGGHTG